LNKTLSVVLSSTGPNETDVEMCLVD